MSKQSARSSSSEEEEDDNQHPLTTISYHKSAVFPNKHNQNKTSEVKDQPLDISVEEDIEQLKPKLALNKENIVPNGSTLYNKGRKSEVADKKKQIAAAFTFKLKNQTASKPKKSDPVSLFQQTSTLWKKDKFLTSRGSNKEGRKLDLSKRNRDYKGVI